MLGHLHDGHLAGQIRGRRGPVAAEGRDTRGEDDLALDRGHVAALLEGLAEPALQGVLRSEVEQFEEGSHGEESSGDFEMESVVHALHRKIGEQGLTQFRQRGRGVESHGGSDASGINDHKIDVANVRLDSVHGCLQIRLGGHIGLVGDDHAGEFGSGLLEDLSTTAQDVDLAGTVGSQSTGHSQANSCIITSGWPIQ